MKKKVLVVMVLCLLVIGAVQPVYAMSRYDQAYNKLGRGLTNIVTGPLEFGEAIELGVAESGFYKGVCYGAIKGVVKSVARVLAGVYEVVSCPIEYPADFQPVIEPEFIFAKN